MRNNVCHFAIHADDIPRARRFYENVFGWTFRPWGPPDFLMIQTGPVDDPGIHGSLQRRSEPVEGKGVIAYECTITVEDVDATATAVEEHGGKVLMPKATIPTVGTLIQFADTEGNVACAMEYDEPQFGG